MENAHLPLEKAQEPNEAAYDPNNNEIMLRPKVGARSKKITFAENTESTEISESQISTSTYKDALSQPASGLSHRQRMMWLQSRRTTGLWVNCDDCGCWRYLPHILDSHELPMKWFCRMNPDPAAADCSAPEAPLHIRDEEDLIHSEYSAGSLVWARLPGWPWWPAMVDDCPDVEQFYWLDGFSDIPTHYNVVFFDGSDVTRAWVAPELLKPYSASKNNYNIHNKFKKRLLIALKLANDAEKLSLHERLSKYSFISRYAGNVNSPRKVSKNELEKFKNKLKRKYNIDFSDESSSESDSETTYVAPEPVRKANKNKVGKKDNPKRVKILKSKSDIAVITETAELEKQQSKEAITDTNITAGKNTDSTIIVNSDMSKQPNSMAVQMGSTALSVPVEQSFDNDTSTTYVPAGSENESELHTSTSVQDIIESIQRSASPNSDDFEF